VITFVAPVYEHAKNSKTDAKTPMIKTPPPALLRSKYDKLHTSVEPRDQKPRRNSLCRCTDSIQYDAAEQYHNAVKKAIDYTFAKAKSFRSVPSQRFSTDFDLRAFELYRSLSRLNPSPFMFYVALEDLHLVGASPEILVRVRDEHRYHPPHSRNTQARRKRKRR
jgi:anthranilate/para-aminobenzoate synthase component I